MKEFAAAITAGCLASTVNVSINRASRTTGDTAIKLANLGIRWKSDTDCCSPTWDRRQRNRFCPATIFWKRLIRTRSSNAARTGGQTGDQSMPIAPYNWMHLNDNIMDPYHVWVLHSTFTGPQFAQGILNAGAEGRLFHMGAGRLLLGSSRARVTDGCMIASHPIIFPSIMSVPETRNLENARSTRITWVVPVDDTHFTTFTAGKVRPGGSVVPERGLRRARPGRK